MIFKAVIEIPKGSFYKYEAEHGDDSTWLKLDRVLQISCPFNYGYIEGLPNSADGDPLDVFVVSEFPITPLTELKIRPLGVLICKDNGVEDNKVIAKIEGDKYQDFDYFKNINFYLANYKKGFTIEEYKIVNDAATFNKLVKLPGF